MASNAIAGTLSFSINGKTVNLKGAFKVRVGGVSRKPVVGPDGVHGYTQENNAPGFDADLTDSGGMSVQALQALDGVTAQADLLNGKSYVLNNAWTAEAQELDAIAGTITFQMDATSCTELTAS